MPLLRKLSIAITVCICLLLLTSCWDQRLLKDLKLVFTLGLDKGENNEIVATVGIRETKKGSTGGSAGEASVAVETASGITLRDTRFGIDRKIPGKYSPSKMRVYLIGEDLGKEDLYSILDVLYRDPRAPLGSKLAIVEGDAGSIIEMKTINETLLTEAVTKLLENASENTLIANETVQSICPVMFDSSSDFHLPIIKKVGANNIEIMGVGLISGRSYTGVTLSPPESTLLLLMSDKKGKKTQFNLMVHENEKIERNNYMTINILKVQQKIKLRADSPESIKAFVHLDLTASIAEYPKNHIVSKKKADELAKKAESILEAQAITILDKIQSANSDILKIGKELKVHHHSVWEKVKWREAYPDIEIIPNVTVKITDTGIIN